MKKSIALLVFFLITFGLIPKNLSAQNKKIETEKNADDESLLLPKVLLQLNLTEKYFQEELYAEKILPYNKALSIVVIPKIATSEIDEYNNDFFEYDSYILLVDNKTGKIKSKFFEPKAWTSDADVLSNIEIDTAPYLLSKNIRGFGIRVNYSGSSNPNPSQHTNFSIFIDEGKTLKRVLKDFPISTFTGEWDMDCAGEFEEIECSILIDKKKTNQFYNLKIKHKITKQVNKQIKGDCIEKKTITNKVTTLRYNNEEYN